MRLWFGSHVIRTWLCLQLCRKAMMAKTGVGFTRLVNSVKWTFFSFSAFSIIKLMLWWLFAPFFLWNLDKNKEGERESWNWKTVYFHCFCCMLWCTRIVFVVCSDVLVLFLLYALMYSYCFCCMLWCTRIVFVVGPAGIDTLAAKWQRACGWKCSRPRGRPSFAGEVWIHGSQRQRSGYQRFVLDRAIVKSSHQIESFS